MTSSQSSFSQKLRKAVLGIDTLSIVIAIVLSLFIGAFIVAFSDQNVQKTTTYFFARPTDFFYAFGHVFASFFTSLFNGAIIDTQAETLTAALRPLTETLTLSVPLILAGLSVAVAFRAGLFNIGAQGQLLIGAIFAGFVGFSFSLPYGIHMVVAIIAAIIGGAIWGGIPGILKARVGANEVVVTIMLNFVAVYFLSRQLQTKLFVGNGQIGKSQHVHDSATYPLIIGGWSRLHLGFIVALIAAWIVWWILERSTFGFELRAAGANPNAAKTAGINTTRVIFLTMVFAGALAGLAATAPVLGTSHVLTDGVAGTYGFDAITVALLGRSRPLGVVLSGILFGALAAGGSTMQAAAGIPVDIVQVTQAIIVLLVAAAEFIKYYRAKQLAHHAAVDRHQSSSSLETASSPALNAHVKKESK